MALPRPALDTNFVKAIVQTIFLLDVTVQRSKGLAMPCSAVGECLGPFFAVS